MNVYIVRDAVEIGHFPRTEMERLAREGKLQPTDYYWHEGMEGWLPLPDLIGAEAWKPISPTPPLGADPVEVSTPSSAPASAASSAFARIKEWAEKMPRRAMIAAICALSILVVLFAVYLTKSHTTETTVAPASSIQNPVASDPVLKRNAFEELKRKIDTLPITPAPPWNATYYDFSVNMVPSGSPYFPWTATIHGGENVIDPDTQATVRRTDFVLTVEYRNGEWTYKDYRAIETDASNGAARQIFDDEKTPVPPDIVGILGLKRNL